MRMGHLRPLSLVVVPLVMILGLGVAQAQQTQTVSLTDFAFGPATLTATVGQQVTWTFRNEGQFPHGFRVEVGGQTIDAVQGDGNVMQGQSTTFTYTFTTPGSFEFWCPVGMHRQRGMVGRLNVVAAGAGQMPGTLPRAGGLPISPPVALAAAAGIASLVTGLLIRARRTRD